MFVDLHLMIWCLVGAIPAVGILAAYRTLRPAPSNRPTSGVTRLLWRGIRSLYRHWQMALLLITGATVTNVVGLNFSDGAFVGVANFIVSVLLVFYWHRENLSDALALAKAQPPSGNVYGLIVRSIFIGVVGLSMAIIPLIILGTGADITELLIGTTSQFDNSFSWTNISLTVAVFVFVISSVLMARWVLMIPAAAVGDSLDYSKAFAISRGIAPPLAGALWIVFLATEMVQRFIELSWTAVDANLSTPDMAEMPFGAVWYDIVVYMIPAEIFYVVYVLVCVGIVSAAFERVRVPQIFVEQYERATPTPDQPAPFD